MKARRSEHWAYNGDYYNNENEYNFRHDILLAWQQRFKLVNKLAGHSSQSINQIFELILNLGLNKKWNGTKNQKRKTEEGERGNADFM